VDLTLSDEQQQLRDALRRLLDQRLAAVVDALPEPPQHDRGQALDDSRTLGLSGLGLPEDVGGSGTFEDLVVAHEELGRGLAAPLHVTMSLAGRLVLRAVGGEGRPWLQSLAAGELVAAPALEEGPDPGAPLTTTVTEVDDELQIDGRKVRVACARDVDELVVSGRDARTGDVVLVRVPVDAPGLEWTEEQRDCDVPHWGVVMRSVRVSATARLGVATGRGLAAYRSDATVLAAARQVGGGRAVLDRTIRHVTAREQFGRPIGTFQAVQHQLADAATDLDAAALAVSQAAWALDTETAMEAERLGAIAALAAGAAFRRSTLIAHQLHGGMGFVLDSPLHLWSARAVADPTTPLTRRHLLDRLAAASGVTAGAVAVPADHRVASPR
jgi:alkylation response protein AidB-like acyl-CoA dehydrogenase